MMLHLALLNSEYRLADIKGDKEGAADRAYEVAADTVYEGAAGKAYDGTEGRPYEGTTHKYLYGDGVRHKKGKLRKSKTSFQCNFRI